MAKNREGEAAPADLGVGGEAPPKSPVGGAIELTPAAWAHRKGLLISGAKQPWVEPHARGGHTEAANLYGWNAHAHHYQGDAAFTLTEADYDKARETALAFPAVELHARAWPWKEGERAMPKSVVETRKAEREAADKAKAERRKAQVS
jgi:hypothetical protein